MRLSKVNTENYNVTNLMKIVKKLLNLKMKLYPDIKDILFTHTKNSHRAVQNWTTLFFRNLFYFHLCIPYLYPTITTFWTNHYRSRNQYLCRMSRKLPLLRATNIGLVIIIITHIKYILLYLNCFVFTESRAVLNIYEA